MANQTIDLSAGLVPNTAPVQNLSGQDSIDLSSGLVPTNQPLTDQDRSDLGSTAVNGALGANGIPVNPLTTGMAKGALETGHTLGSLIHGAIKNATGYDVKWLPSSNDEPAELQSANAGESVGKVGENIAEFLMGDEALKSVSVAEKLGLAEKVSKLAKQSPTLAKILSSGLTAIRTGTVGTSQGLAHGEDAGTALEQGAVTGVGGGAVEAASGVLPKIAGTAKTITSDVPADTESKLVNAVGDIAEKAGFERSDASTLKEATDHLATSYQQRAATAYKQLDDAAPGFQELKDKIAQGMKAVRAQQQIDPDRAAEIARDLEKNKSAMEDLLSPEQKQQWVDADADWSKYKALQTVKGKVNAAATDLTSNALQDVSKLKSGMQSLANRTVKGTPVDVLQRAFGNDANTLKNIVQSGAKTAEAKSDALNYLYGALKGAAIVGGASTVVHYVYDPIKGLVGAGN
jgi:hypothetical protein